MAANPQNPGTPERRNSHIALPGSPAGSTTDKALAPSGIVARTTPVPQALVPVSASVFSRSAPARRRGAAPLVHRDVVGFTPSPAGTKSRRSNTALKRVGAVTVMGFAGALIATMALPAYAFSPSDDAEFAASQAQILRTDQAQTVAVGDSVVLSAITRDNFASAAAPVPEPVAAPAAAAVATEEPAAEEETADDTAAEREETADDFAETEGPSVDDLLAAPPSTSYSLAAVFETALQYQGVPYVYGGADPSGFDCSGFVMYVFAQYGISMPHSSAGQGAMGTVISESEAQPGDLVIMDGHDGFYAGNGNILHAPYEGASVRVQPLWTSDYYIVRING